MEKLKQQFHILLSHLTDKYLKNKYRLITEILFIQNLIWKIRGRNFPILANILKVFEELKSCEIDDKEDLFKFKYNYLYYFNYYNKSKKYNILFEVFKAIAGQILKKEKNFIIKDSDTNNNDLSLTRDISKISSFEYNNVFQTIFLYFTDIKSNIIFYHDFILFF